MVQHGYWIAGIAVATACASGCSGSSKLAPIDGNGAGDAPAAGDAGAAPGDAPGCNIYSGDAGMPGPNVPLFPSADAVLDDAKVQAAVAAVQKQLAAGTTFVPTLDSSPPDVTGTFTVAQGTAKLVATSDGTQVGATLGASVTRVAAFCSDVLQDDQISTVNGQQVTTGTSLVYVRGSGQSFSTYGVSEKTCTVQGADFTYIAVGIATGTIDRPHGKESYGALLVTVDTEGTLTAPCAATLIHALQAPGGWVFIEATATLSR